MGMSQTLGAISPKVQFGHKNEEYLQRDQVEKEQNGQITPELQGGNERKRSSKELPGLEKNRAAIPKIPL